MNPRTMIVGVLAVVCGLSAMVLVQALRKPGGPVIEKVSVVFAASEIKPGEAIEEAMLEAREIPKSDAPDDAIHKIADAVGRAAMAQVDQGDLIREKKLAERGAGRGMAALIKSGMRAITIPTPSFNSSMAGFLMPGNRVDILLTTVTSGRTEDESGGASTTVLLQNVEILAVHTTVNTPTTNRIDPDQARSVTVQVSPDDANRLQLAQAKGTLSLSLRNLKDEESAKTHPANLSDFQPAAPRVVAAPAPPPTPAPPAPAREVRDLARSIPRGMRAFTITTPTHSRSLVRTIRAGHHVDVLLTMNLKSDVAGAGDGKDQGEFRGISTTLLQDQEVLEIHPAIDANANMAGSSEESRAITLLVTPRDAQRLDLAESAGKLHLALRPEDPDYDQADEPPLDPVTSADLLGVRKADEPLFSTVTLGVRTLRGTAVGESSTTYFVRQAARDQGTSRTKRPPGPSPIPGPGPPPPHARVANPNLARRDGPGPAAVGLRGRVEGPSPSP